MESDESREGPSIEINQERVELPAVLPVLPVRNVVLFPGVTAPLVVGRPKSLAALEAAGQSGLVVVATQRDPATDEPGLEDLHPIACIARLARIIGPRREDKHAIVVGVVRTRMGPVTASEPAMCVRVQPVPEPRDDSPKLQASS